MVNDNQSGAGFRVTEIGLIPEDWQIQNLSSISEILISNVDKIIKNDEVPISLCNYLNVYQNESIDNRIPFTGGTATENEISKFAIKQGDILITKDSETSKDIASAAIVTENIDNLVCGYHLAIIRSKSNQIISDYLVKSL